MYEPWHLLVLLALMAIPLTLLVLLVVLLCRGSAAPPQTRAAPPGWYPDHDGRLRWWDGATWTEHTQQ